MKRIHYKTTLFLIPAVLFSMHYCRNGLAVEPEDFVKVGASYFTHLFLHEMGHHLVAEEVGADSHNINFFIWKDGTFYPGVSFYKEIPKDALALYSMGGERMACLTFEYAFRSYVQKPTWFNKSLMFFSCADFLIYTWMSTYVYPENRMYDPNLFCAESNISKETFLTIISAKTLLNVYRVINRETNYVPLITTNNNRICFEIRFEW